ncbi:MAG: hypothetical protein AB7E95_06245 [Kiritimatiellales bacterium]
MKAVKYLILFAAVLLLSFRFSPLCMGIESDQSVYLLSARSMLSGGMPYVDFWDHKPPFLYLIYTVAERFGGLWPYWWMECTVLFAGLCLFLRTMQRILTPVSGAVACATILVLSRSLNFSGYSTPEAWAVAAGLLIFGLVFKSGAGLWSWAIAGLLGGLCFFIKPTAVLLPGSVGVCQLILTVIRRSRTELSRTAVYVFSAVAVFLAGHAWIYLSGFFQEYWQACIVYNGMYAVSAFRSGSVVDYATRLMTTFSGSGYFGLLGIVIAAGFFIFRKQDQRLRFIYLTCSAVFSVETVCIALSGRISGHYFSALLIPASVCFGIFMKGLIESCRPSVTAAVLIPVALPVLMLTLYWNIAQGLVKGTFLPQKLPAKDEAVIRLLNTVPSGKAFVWDEFPSRQYYLAQKKPASRFGYCLPLWVPCPMQADLLKTLTDDLKKNPPEVIIDGRHPELAEGKIAAMPYAYYALKPEQLAGLRAFIAEHYVQTEENEFFSIFRINPFVGF